MTRSKHGTEGQVNDMTTLSIEAQSTIQRALGIIEGLALGMTDPHANMLNTAVEMIDSAMQGSEKDA